jgi:hypothetical protein
MAPNDTMTASNLVFYRATATVIPVLFTAVVITLRQFDPRSALAPELA